MDPKPRSSEWAAAVGSPAAMIGVMLVACTVVGLGLGLLMDRWVGTRPWGMLTGLLLGIVAGFLNIFRTLQGLRRGRPSGRPAVKGEGT